GGGRGGGVGGKKGGRGGETRARLLKFNTAGGRHLRLDRRARLKRERDPKAVEDALSALTRNAAGGNANLLALAIDAARAKATVGEISSALEQGFGRHRAEIKPSTGDYKRSDGAMAEAVAPG